MDGKPVGHTLWVSDSPIQYATEQAALEAACRYAERIVLGVVAPATGKALSPTPG